MKNWALSGMSAVLLATSGVMGAVLPGTPLIAISGDNAGVDGSGNVNSLIDETDNTTQRFGNVVVAAPTLQTQTFANGSTHKVINFGGTTGAHQGIQLIKPNLNLQSLNIFVIGDTTATQTSGEFFTNYQNSGGTSYGYAVGNSDSVAGTVKFFTGTDFGVGSENGSSGLVLTNGTYYKINATVTQPTGKTVSTDDGATISTVFNSPYGDGGNNTVPYQGDNNELAAIGVLDAFGGAQFLQGNIAEVLVYDDTGKSAAQIAAETAAVNSYLGAKYALPEPSSLGLLSIGGLAVLRRRRK